MAFRDVGKVNGSAGCNNHLGNCELEGTLLTIIVPETYTSKICDTPEGIMEQEAAFSGH
jgi:heat shock protein HslJ